ncbi:MAG TPA: ABC transporter ATP-binding protein [Gemmatimonadales bacterium]|nr:ABC transporter ATP-binding protein [Gemmatimonadales bacterium]
MTDDKKKRKLHAKDVWREARELVWRNRGRLAIGGALMIVNRVAGLVIPYLSKAFIDKVANGGQYELLMPLALIAGTATLVQATTTFGLSQVLGVSAQRAITDMRVDVESHVSRLPISFFDSTKSGILISRVMTDAEGIRNLVGTGLVRMTGGIVTAGLAIFLLFRNNAHLTLLTLAVLSLFAVAMAIAFNKLRPIFRERSKLNAAVTGRLAETLGGIRVVKSYTAERSERLIFARGAHNLFRNVAKSITGVSTITAFTTLIVGSVGVLIIVVGGQALRAGTMTAGDIMQFVLLTGLVAAPLMDMAAIGTQISEAFAGLDRIRELQRMPTEFDSDEHRQPLGDVDGEITFDDVSFEYVPDTPVLRHVSFRAPAGSTTALVGSSGSGKSTLISLVMTFNHPQSGKIFIDGHDLETIRLHDYRSRLGVVLQDNFLFDGTVAENIRFARPHATMDEVRRVARIAHCDDFITEFERGYETVIGERGVKLSGGQRQRIAIARAILADPKILILDEATSSLDSESEALIQDGLNALRRGRTTFVIAHRLSTIQSADQILVLEHGEIVERGTHEELLAKDGRYRQLYDKQYRLERNRFINPGEDPTRDLERETVTAREAPNGGDDIPRDL